LFSIAISAAISSAIFVHILLSTLPYQGFAVTGYIRAVSLQMAL
jgi:hypothetical protein